MLEFLRGLWPRSFWEWAGALLASLSLLALGEQLFQLGFGPTLQTLIEYYNGLVHAIVGAFIETPLRLILSFFSVTLNVEPHWKHIFVLVGIYVFRNVQPPFKKGHYGTMVFNFVLGLTVATCSSIAAGQINLSAAGWWGNFFIAAVPVLGFFFYDAARGLWGAIWFRGLRTTIYGLSERPTFSAYLLRWLRNIFLRDVVAIAVVIVGLLVIDLIGGVASPGVVMLAVVVGYLSIYLIVRGAIDARNLANQDGRWSDRFSRTYSGALGAAMLNVFFWVTCLVVLNAGLRFYGL